MNIFYQIIFSNYQIILNWNEMEFTLAVPLIVAINKGTVR